MSVRTACMLASLVLLVPAAAAGQDAERRAFEPGGPANLMRTGESSHSQVLSANRTSGGFSFSSREVCDYELYLDEPGARQALEKLRGQDVAALLKAERIQPVIINSDFPKLIVLSFSYTRTGREVRDFFSQELEKSVGRRSKELGKFLDQFRDDMKSGDEAEIRIVADQVVVMVHDKQGPQIVGRDLARALLKLHVNSRSLSALGPLLQ